jgi:hypothetical protein
MRMSRALRRTAAHRPAERWTGTYACAARAPGRIARRSGWARGQRFGDAALYQALGQRVQAAGLEHLIPHVLWHTAAQRRLSADGSEGGLMAVAGWKRRDMLDRYTQATAAERAATEARQLNLGDLDYCSPPGPGCWLEPRSGSCLFEVRLVNVRLVNVRLGGHAKGVVDS